MARRLAQLSPADWLVLPVLYLFSLLSLASLRFGSLPRVASRLCGLGRLFAFARGWDRERVVRLADMAARVAQGPGRCLARSLVLYGLFRGRGERAELWVGVARQAGRMDAHAWLEEGGRVVGERPDSLARYSSLVRVA